MITLGFIGIYIGYIFQEVKGRPIYLIKEKQLGKEIIDKNGGSISENTHGK
jgi:hypothetical protein